MSRRRNKGQAVSAAVEYVCRLCVETGVHRRLLLTPRHFTDPYGGPVEQSEPERAGVEGGRPHRDPRVGHPAQR